MRGPEITKPRNAEFDDEKERNRSDGESTSPIREEISSTTLKALLEPNNFANIHLGRI